MKNKLANVRKPLIKFALLAIQVVLLILMMMFSMILNAHFWLNAKHISEFQITKFSLLFMAFIGITYFIMKKYFSKKEFIKVVIILILIPLIMVCFDKFFNISFLDPILYFIAIIFAMAISMIVDRLYKALGFEN